MPEHEERTGAEIPLALHLDLNTEKYHQSRWHLRSPANYGLSVGLRKEIRHPAGSRARASSSIPRKLQSRGQILQSGFIAGSGGSPLISSITVVPTLLK